jgi:hypothetical protein
MSILAIFPRRIICALLLLSELLPPSRRSCADEKPSYRGFWFLREKVCGG